MSTKVIELFLRLIIVIGIGNLANMKFYRSEDMVFRNIFLRTCQEIVFLNVVLVYMRLIAHWKHTENRKVTAKFMKLRILLKFYEERTGERLSINRPYLKIAYKIYQEMTPV